MFAVNIRSLRGHGVELPALDGDPHWERGELTSLERTGEYLGAPTAKLVFSLKERTHELSGPLPPSFVDQIHPGLSVEGHVDYEMLDTVRTSLWDASPLAVLTETAAQLGLSTVPDELGVLRVEASGTSMEVCLSEDGWLMLTYKLGERQEVSVDLRADFDISENAHMLTERLGIMPDGAEHADALGRLSDETLRRLEEFVTRVQGWVCIDEEDIDFECALPFPHVELVVMFVQELGPLMARIEEELLPSTGGAGDRTDGVW